MTRRARVIFYNPFFVRGVGRSWAPIFAAFWIFAILTGIPATLTGSFSGAAFGAFTAFAAALAVAEAFFVAALISFLEKPRPLRAALKPFFALDY